MATNYVRDVERSQSTDGAEHVETTHVNERVSHPAPVYSATSQTKRIIGYVFGVLETLLAIRFFLMLFGANPSNGFANFVYTLSKPFVVPFQGIFGKPLLGVSQFETSVIVAMVVYALIGWGISALVELGNRDARPVEL